MLKSRKVIMPGLAFWHNTLHCSRASAAAKLSCRALRAPGAVGWEPLSRIPLESWVWTGNISHSMLQVTSQSTGREFWIQFPAPQLLASAWREILGSFPVLLWFIHVHGREQHIPKIGKSDCKAFRRGSGELGIIFNSVLKFRSADLFIVLSVLPLIYYLSYGRTEMWVIFITLCMFQFTRRLHLAMRSQDGSRRAGFTWGLQIQELLFSNWESFEELWILQWMGRPDLFPWQTQ